MITYKNNLQFRHSQANISCFEIRFSDTRRRNSQLPHPQIDLSFYSDLAPAIGIMEMRTLRIIVYIVVLGIAVSKGKDLAHAELMNPDLHSQHGDGRRGYGNVDFSRLSGPQSRGGNREKPPRLAALDKLMNVTSMEDFLSLLTIGGRPATAEDIYSKYISQSGEKVVDGGGLLAVPDQCSPRPTTVDLGVKSENPRVVYFPTCAKVPRCGGCCTSPHVSCVPDQIETLNLNVIKAVVPYPDAVYLMFSSFKEIPVESHVRCRLHCSLSPDACGPKKIFQPERCGCKCAESKRCRGNTVWDEETCSCQCANKQVCCCGMVFNSDKCECEVASDRQVSSAKGPGALSRDQVSDYFEKITRQQQQQQRRQSNANAHVGRHDFASAIHTGMTRGIVIPNPTMAKHPSILQTAVRGGTRRLYCINNPAQ
ncbi:platelet-derived growth factor subunit a [Plakobranchus ocellatus]|uniref:Platelet-derived growth factor subunit a n=1 Tax=Plakobranchus ocellatus TaxID=259542 RepID=A0AAV4D4F9_9GAST|nr:platelet-derived growth factor subunit a [Plakobranchus ocellatus]